MRAREIGLVVMCPYHAPGGLMRMGSGDLVVVTCPLAGGLIHCIA